MISVLLIILKIIGITLLVIIGFILLALLLVLFVPLRYQFSGSYEEVFRCKGKVTWLLHFISFRVTVEETVIKDLRILGIPASFFIRKKKEPAEDEHSSNESTKTEVKENSISDVKVSSDADNSFFNIGEDNAIHNEASVEAFDSSEQSQTDTDNSEKKSIFQKMNQKIHEIMDKIKGIIQKIKDFIEKAKDFIINIKSKKKTLKRYMKILKSDTFKAAFTLCKKQIYGILRHIFPGKMLVNVTYGLEDPADTGYILGVYGMLPAFIGERVVLHPDFNNAVFRGDFYMKGRIRGWTILHSVLCVITDKNCKKLFHIVKKEIANERK